MIKLIEPKETEREQKIAQANLRLLHSNDSNERQDFMLRFEDDTRFYFHQQLTVDEKTRKQELKQLDIPIDRVRPIIRRMVAKIVKNKPIIAALTEDLSARELSRRVNAQIQYCVRISKGLSQIRRALMNCIRGGLGYLWVYNDNKSASGEQEVKIKYVSPKKVFPDYALQDSLFDDARNIQILEKVMVSDALQLFEDDLEAQSKIILSANTSYQDETVIDAENDVGRVVVGSVIENQVDEMGFDAGEHEDDVRLNGWVELITTYRKRVRPVYFLETISPEGRVEKIKLQEDEAEAHKKAGSKVKVGWKPYIKEEITTPDYFLREQDMDWLTEYPITPMIWEDTENAYPISETFFIKGHQRLQNKYYEVVLANAQAVSFPNVYFEEDTFVDEDKALNSMGTPGGAVKLKTGAIRNQKFEKTYAQPLNQAFFTLYEQLKHEQEHQTSSYPLGDPRVAPETAKTLINLDNIQDQPMAINVDSIEACLERVFKNVLAYQSVVYDGEKLLLIDTNPENNVTVNKANVEIDEKTGRIIPKKIDNDISRIDYDISLVAGSMSPLDRTSEFEYKMLAVEKLGATPEFAMTSLPVVGVEDEIVKMDTVKQMQQALMQSQQMVEELANELKQAQARAEKAERQVTDEAYAAKYKVALARLEDLIRQVNKNNRTLERKITVIEKNYTKKVAQARKDEKAAQED